MMMPSLWEDEKNLLSLESSLSISHLLNDATQNGGVSPYLFEIAPAQGSRAASFTLEVDRDGDSSETFCEPRVGGFEINLDGGNPLAEENGNFKMSPDPEGCNSLFFCGNDESASESLDASSEDWMADCLNDVEIPSTSDDLNALGEFDCYFDISELNNLLQTDIDADFSQPQIFAPETFPPQITPRAGSHVIGEKQTVAGKTKAVLYPFALMKPCCVEGDVTLTDINRRISSTFAGIPHVKELNSSQPMYTSAFTGKPVVSRTKVHTEGNGSIIIIRTRG